MAATSRVHVLAIGLVLLAAAVGAVPPPQLELVTDGGLSVDFHAATCPKLEGIVRAAVEAERRNDVQLTAGLLRIFFHDCLPQGCDASILLAGEKSFGPNISLQDRAVKLIESIRAKVHAVCGATVSCADIIALATRDAVSLAGGPSIAMPQGRRDSLAPATQDQIRSLPAPDFDVNRLLGAFGGKGLADPADLVALSGGHTVGKASCSFIRGNDGFSQKLAANCNKGGTGGKQSLDILTPDVFDNSYFIALRTSRGVLLSDQGLAGDQRTAGLVATFSANQTAFFEQFARSFVKLGNLKPAPGAGSEIRNDCSRPNKPPRAAVDDEEQGFAASA